MKLWPRYYVHTWDTATQSFTPQPGVRKGPYTLWGLRLAIRKLQALDYPCDYNSRIGMSGDPSVSISRADNADEVP